MQIKVSHSVTIPDEMKIARYRRAPELGPKILFFSGGTALNPLSRYLTEFTHNSIHLVTPFDSGGSSARLRETFQMPSVGDLRSRLMALADNTVHGHPEIYRLFAHRFAKDETQEQLLSHLDSMKDGSHELVTAVPNPMRKIIRRHLGFFREAMPLSFDLRGASVGNLILTGGYLNHVRHLDPVVFTFSKLVEAHGTVRTISGEFLHLIAILDDGTVVRGQRELTGKEVPPITSKVLDIWLSADLESSSPTDLPIRKKTADLISQAELICYPMGSFYTSLIANLLPRGVSEAIRKNHCPKVFIPNVGRDPEMLGLSVSDCVAKLLHVLKGKCGPNVATEELLNFVVVDDNPGSYVEPFEIDDVREMGVEVISGRFVDESERSKIDNARLAAALLSLT